MKTPSEDQSSYYSRKVFTYIILQGVCNADMFFSDVYIGWPGKVHNARVHRFFSMVLNYVTGITF